jgi:hypothetical protein
MAATNALLASGGMTHCCFRCGRLVAALQHETEHGQAGAAERDKNDAAPPQKIGAHQHDDDVEDGMS